MSLNIENSAKKKLLYRKKNKLKRKKWIDFLFNKGQVVKNYPLKVIYAPLELGESPMVGVSVPKKLFKHATERNRLKRLMREAYRINQAQLEVPQAAMFVYISGKKLNFEEINNAMQVLLVKMQENAE
uniref:ribonuclease P protein component n=1 Tax=Ornithobacterium rhinotracheale TaxID=28251 RepID=UPI0039A477F6